MSQSERCEPFLGWNLASSDELAPERPQVAPSLPGKIRPVPSRIKPWDETRSIARPTSTGVGVGGVDLAAHFTLHPDASLSDEQISDALAGETVGHGHRRSDSGDGSGSGDELPSFPRCGEGIGGFRLVSELGRGAFGRVYLAEESGLGNRLVALKVTRPEGEEPRLLARLQHTHIVPIHSMVDDPESGLRLMCMPYFGGANLAQVLDATGHHMPAKATGLSLIEALDIVGGPVPSLPDAPASLARRRRKSRPEPIHPSSESNPAKPISSVPIQSILRRIPWWSRSLTIAPKPFDERGPMQPARRFLRESSFVRASAWIAARLAEGLEHAHSKGLLHRDLKPSNILIAADGTPMLLDFNLAADAISVDEGDRAMIGGTLPYMAPEHLDAFNPQGTTPPGAVDERADIYALGLILFEMIAGVHPFPEPPPGRQILETLRIMTEQRRRPAPSARAFNPEIPRGLDAIVRKCLDPDPERRHARAGDLAEDLRRFLDDRPLKFTSEPSVVEVVGKWARRNPKISGATPVALISIALIVGIGGLAWTLSHHFQEVSARLKLRLFERNFLECQFLLNIANGPAKNLGRGIGLAEEAIQQAGINASGNGFRSWIAILSAEEQASMRSDLAELMLLSSRARVYQAERSRSEEKRRRALDLGIIELGRAERLDPKPPQALFAERGRYYSALGEAEKAAKDRARRDATPPTTGRDYYLLGTFLLTQDQPDRAEPVLVKAVGLDPRRFWGWFSLGLCHFDQERYGESATDFAVCAVLAPKFAWPWMNRGLALARAGRLIEAKEAYDRAVEADPQNPEALTHRGLTRLELNDADAAVEDLEKAVALTRNDVSTRQDPAMLVALGEALVRAGRPEEGLRLLAERIEAEPDAPLPRVVRGTVLLSTDPTRAEADFRQVLTGDPGHPIANLGMARLFRTSDPVAALAFADRAVTGDTSRIDALELRAWLRGKLGDPLAVVDVDRLIQTPTPYRLFNAACALALLTESQPRADPRLTARALDLLRRALETGFPVELLRNDPDFKSLRSHPTFQKWLEAAGPPAKMASPAR